MAPSAHKQTIVCVRNGGNNATRVTEGITAMLKKVYATRKTANRATRHVIKQALREYRNKR